MSNCGLCGRRKQSSRKWKEDKCVCCDVHEGKCKHKGNKTSKTPTGFSLQDYEWPILVAPGVVERRKIQKNWEP